MKKHRKIKLQEKHHSTDYGVRRWVVPELRISGAWLSKAGFKAGERVNIEVSENQLIIKPIENDDPAN